MTASDIELITPEDIARRARHRIANMTPEQVEAKHHRDNKYRRRVRADPELAFRERLLASVRRAKRTLARLEAEARAEWGQPMSRARAQAAESILDSEADK